MADVFLSYAREDHDRAQFVVNALATRGWSVFWDPSIPPGPSFRKVLTEEIDTARCVVVLWSRKSVASEWVQDEAERAKARDVLVAARIDDVPRPLGFGQRQTANLVGWAGDMNASSVQALLAAVAELLTEITLWPVDFNVVTGCRDPHVDLAPTVNMTCRLTNSSKRTVELTRLEVFVEQDHKPVYRMVWALFYSSHRWEHVRIERDPQNRVEAGATWERGVQFRESQIDLSSVWTAGAYEFELVGWVNPGQPRYAPNVRTTFRGTVNGQIEEDLRYWREASPSEWDRRRYSDRAIGFPLLLTDIKSGL